MTLSEGIFVGTVMHKRMRPVRHEFRYSVFSLLIDVDRMDEIANGLRLLSVDRGNLFSIFRRDHGDGDGQLRRHLDGLATRMIGPERMQRWLMLTYPRIVGYVFNPLTVYYGLDGDGHIRGVVYEVSNTFGERHSYALPVEADGAAIRQTADKAFYVSPFNPVAGRYRFRTRAPEETAHMTILLEDEAGPMFAAAFSGKRQPLTDKALSALLLRHWFMTFKVWGGIHYEALRLWIKGLKIYPRPAKGEETEAYARSLIMRPTARK
ncbi:MAG: DUF1365 domain-containing protein [Rhizobiaceae bacterium MnEN-MB40S]|nr:MAG: DUF1365 domain-containing protein [Rhizobiaceae bacterium MnEN-MB40S]